MRAHILVLILLPVAILAGLIATSTKVPVPSLGRDYVLRVDLPASGSLVDLPDVGGDADWPLVVIDPGHGGHDPGASGQGYKEKSIVLDLARALRDELLEQGGVRVALTRDGDRYLEHGERFEIARRLDADLFLSIHADSAGTASEVAGASIYTLSNEASSRAAAAFANRENSSGRLNGADLAQQSDAVNDILVELSRRRTQDESTEFARLIERAGREGGAIRFHPQALRSAALLVLRAPDIPSVLFESGFITNQADAARLASAEGRERFAEVMARAVLVYFARQQES